MLRYRNISVPFVIILFINVCFVVDNWTRALDLGLQICVVFFDVQKAFNTVPHLLLLQKLNTLNVNPYLMRWLENYLTNRTQYVGVDRHDSLPPCGIGCTTGFNS